MLLNAIRRLLAGKQPTSLPVAIIPPEFEGLFQEAESLLAAKQKKLKECWGVGREENWGVHQNGGVLHLTFEDGTVIEADAQAIGSYSAANKTWEWAWNNPNIDDTFRRDSYVVSEYGCQEGIALLSTGILSVPDESIPPKLCALAAKIMNSDGIYTGHSGLFGVLTSTPTCYFSVKNFGKMDPAVKAAALHSSPGLGITLDELRRRHGDAVEISKYRPDLYPFSHVFKQDDVKIHATPFGPDIHQLSVSYEAKQVEDVAVLLERHTGISGWKKTSFSDPRRKLYFAPYVNDGSNSFYSVRGAIALVRQFKDLTMEVTSDVYPDLLEAYRTTRTPAGSAGENTNRSQCQCTPPV